MRAASAIESSVNRAGPLRANAGCTKESPRERSLKAMKRFEPPEAATSTQSPPTRQLRAVTGSTASATPSRSTPVRRAASCDPAAGREQEEKQKGQQREQILPHEKHQAQHQAGEKQRLRPP